MRELRCLRGAQATDDGTGALLDDDAETVVRARVGRDLELLADPARDVDRPREVGRDVVARERGVGAVRRVLVRRPAHDAPIAPADRASDDPAGRTDVRTVDHLRRDAELGEDTRDLLDGRCGDVLDGVLRAGALATRVPRLYSDVERDEGEKICARSDVLHDTSLTHPRAGVVVVDARDGLDGP